MKVIATIEKDGHQGGRVLHVTAETTVGYVMTWLKMLEDTGYKVTSCQFCRSRNGFETLGLVPDKVPSIRTLTPEEISFIDAEGEKHLFKLYNPGPVLDESTLPKFEGSESWSEGVFTDREGKKHHYRFNGFDWLKIKPLPFVFASGPDEVTFYDDDGTPHKYKFDEKEWSEI